MTSEEILSGVTNDMVLRRLKMFFITRGLPGGKYLLTHSKCAIAKDGKFRGQLDLTLKEADVTSPGNVDVVGQIHVVVVFVCEKDPPPHLTLEITGMIPKPGRGVDYLFAANLRPLDGEAS